MTTAPKTIRLEIPHPNSPGAPRLAAVWRLGHIETTSSWLPADGPEWLAPLRARHLELLQAAAEALAAIPAERERWSLADEKHHTALRAALRSKGKKPVDRRVPESARADLLRPLEEASAAALEVLAEHIQVTVDAIREHEQDWLTSLRASVAAIEDKHREAKRLLAEARAEAFTLDRSAVWVKRASDDAGMGQQPAPVLAPAPRTWQPQSGVFERRWHEQPASTPGYAPLDTPMDPGDIAPTDILPLDDRSGTPA